VTAAPLTLLSLHSMHGMEWGRLGRAKIIAGQAMPLDAHAQGPLCGLPQRLREILLRPRGLCTTALAEECTALAEKCTHCFSQWNKRMQLACTPLIYVSPGPPCATTPSAMCAAAPGAARMSSAGALLPYADLVPQLPVLLLLLLLLPSHAFGAARACSEVTLPKPALSQEVEPPCARPLSARQVCASARLTHPGI